MNEQVIFLTSMRVSSSVQQLARMLRARSRVFLEHSGCLSRSSRGRTPPWPLNLAMPALSPLMCCVLMATRARHWDILDLLSVSLLFTEPACSPDSAPGLWRWARHQVREDSGGAGAPSLECILWGFRSPFPGDEAMVHWKVTCKLILFLCSDKYYKLHDALLNISSEFMRNKNTYFCCKAPLIQVVDVCYFYFSIFF